MIDPRISLDRRRFLGLAAMAGALPVVPLTSVSKVAAAGATTELPTAALATAVTETMHALSIPGAVVLVDRLDMETWSAGFGVSDLQSKAPMKPDMHVRIGSITKTMTATVVLQLVDEGAMTLNDTLADLLPAHANLPYAEQITLRHLLGMTSGIFNVLDDESVFARIMADPSRDWTPQEMIEISRGHDPSFAPGATFEYSNTNYLLLGLLIERVTSQPVAAAFDRRLFAPLEMTETSLPAGPELPAPFPRGYSVDPTVNPDENQAALAVNGVPLKDWTALNPSVAWAAGGVVSTIGDLHLWLGALIDGTLISDALQRERLTFTPVERDPGEPSYGYGLGIANFDGAIGHDGSILGYHSFAAHRPETGESIVVVANLDPAEDGADAATEVARAIDDVLTATPAEAR